MHGPEPIAVVGLACRFPGADGPEAFWQLVVDGVDAITDMPGDRFDADALYDAQPGARGKIVSRQGGFLREIDRFEPSFFDISPREAACIDPQQRLLLEVAWEAFEDAGLTRARLAGSATGVFVGMWTSEYESKMFGASPDIDLYVTTGGGRYAASGRLSYTFDLRGPSLTLDTACSSSLVAVHLACQSLRSGESEMALAGGVNLILEPHITIGYSRSAMLSADGRCRFGDARASGYVRSEGVGLVLLKPLARALADGDPIRALIRGSAVNNDGQGSGLLVAPSPTVQAAMLRQAYRAAGVDPARVGYVEAHGTGTRVGDPVELTALGEVLGEGRPPGHPCLIGSVKTNIGHAEAASGIAGLIKAVFCLERRLIPPSLHFSEPNPRIPWDRLPLEIARTAQPWPAAFTPAFAGVNSFGVTGTNAHVVLEAAPAPPARASAEAVEPRVRLLPLSAKTPDALRALAERWIPRLELEATGAGIDDLCYTAAVRRTAHPHRLGVVGATGGALADALRAHLHGESRPGLAAGQVGAAPPRVVFVFPGQGSQWLGMGRALLATEPVFAEALQRCDEALAPHVSCSVVQELRAEAAHSNLERIDVVQPVLFAVQVALAALWRAWGVEPSAVVGHSMGEVAAAHVAGALSLADAARVIGTRSRLLRGIAGRGAMAMVELSLDEARRALAGREDRLSIAVSNSARSTVISGDVGALDELLAGLERRGVFGRRVKVDVASHSPQVDALRPELLTALAGLAPRATTLPLCSTVTGAIADGTTLGAEYWVRNLREPVLFSTALERLAADGCDVVIEMSSHPLLVSAVQDTVRAALVLPSGRREEDERAVMLESLAALWTRGYPVDWSRLGPGEHHVAPAPSYPWQRERFWYEAGRPRRVLPTTGHPLLTTHLTPAAMAAGTELWEGTIVVAELPCLTAGPAGPLAAGACLDAILGAIRPTRSGALMLTELEFPAELALAGDATFQLAVQPASGGTHEARLSGRPAGASGWTTLARAVLAVAPSDAGGAGAARLDLEAISARTHEIEERGPAGPPAHDPGSTLTVRRFGDGEGLGRLQARAGREGCAVHPDRLEAGLSLLTGAVAADEVPVEGWRVTAIRRVVSDAPLDRAAWIYATESIGETAGHRVGDLSFLDASGAAVLQLQGVQFEPRVAAPIDRLLHRVEWQPRARAAVSAARRQGRWLVVGYGGGAVAAIVAALEAAGQRCVLVAPADAIAGKIDEVLQSAGPPFVGCVHLGSLDVDPQASPLAPRAAERGWASALALVQALGRRTATVTPRLWLVTRGAQSAAAASSRVSLGAAAVWGLGAVIAYEHPSLATTRVDLDAGPGAIDAAVLVEELLLGHDVEDQVAFRGATCYVARLIRGVGEAARELPISADGAYLVTGGLGGLGLLAARWLVAQGARQLTVMGRRAPSPAAARALDELRSMGAAVTVAAGDVSRRDDVQRVVAEASAGRPLRGVIHAAGTLDDALLTDLDHVRVAGVMAAKVDGALHLDAATREAPLDFFVGFSSVVGVLGSPGQANYAAANAALDAVIAQRRAQGRPALSIAWGPWARVGLAAARGDRGRRLATRGLASLAPAEGLEALGRLLGAAGTVLVMHLDPARWSQAHATGARSLLAGLHEAAAPDTAARGLPAILQAAAPAERRGRLESHLREEVGHVLRVAPSRVERETPLKSFGLNSLLSLELRNRLEAALGLTLPATLVWNYPTVAALAGHLEERLGLVAPVEAETAAGDPELERLLTEIQGLSDDEVRRLLAEGRAAAHDE